MGFPFFTTWYNSKGAASFKGNVYLIGSKNQSPRHKYCFVIAPVFKINADIDIAVRTEIFRKDGAEQKYYIRPNKAH